MKTISYGLENKVVVVTGGSRGIGLALAKALLDQKARVVICSRKQDGLDQAVEELQGGDRLLALTAHIAKAEDVDTLFDKTMETFGCLDGLINNMGMNIITSVVDADPSLWQKIIDSNLNGAFLCSRRAGQIMRALQDARKAPGQERIYVAGEKEHEKEKLIRERGIPVNPHLRRELQVMRDELNISGYEACF